MPRRGQRPAALAASLVLLSTPVRASARAAALKDCRPTWEYSFEGEYCGFEFLDELRGVYDERRGEATRPIMIDVGANQGMSLMPYLSLGWEVLAFEPSPRLVRVIQANLDANQHLSPSKRVRLVSAVASNATGSRTLYTPLNGKEGTNSVNALAVKYFMGAVSASVTRAVTVDEAFAHEGFEAGLEASRRRITQAGLSGIAPSE